MSATTGTGSAPAVAALMAAKGLTLVGASAGSGKTHRLTEEVIAAIDPGSQDAIALEGLIAVTYTKKAAAELGRRIRRALVEREEFERAQKLPLAYLGTVHAVCLRLVQEFAIDAGLSPEVDVLPGSEARLLNQALEWGLDFDFRQQIQALADTLQLRWDQLRRRTDWLTPVQDIMALARGNRIAAERLPAMAERSLGRLLSLLGPEETDAEALDLALVEALKQAVTNLGRVDDQTNATEKVRGDVAEALRRAETHELLWSDWVRLSKLKPGKAASGAVALLRETGARVDGHPRLREELAELTRGIYEAARVGLVAYDAWKRKRCAVDFVDMVDRALTLVEHSEVSRELRERLQLLVVDEFQDTSPLQLALFVRLHQLTGRSTWVGDKKQCIFEYAGADPALMEAVTSWALAAGGTTEQLPGNWRSRPELVEACSHLFSAAFERHGYGRHEVEVSAQRKPLPELARLPPMGVWYLETTNQEGDAAALAEGVRGLVAEPDATPVVDRTTKKARPLRPGDVAVLVATNLEAERVAGELARRGVHSVIARAGLLATPEGTLTEAALRCLIDPFDTLAVATIDALIGFAGQDPDAWLDSLVVADASRRAAEERGDKPSPRPSSAPVRRLEALRPQADALSPCEALDRVIAVLDLAALCARWPDSEQRLGNLDALRALAAAYEEHCERQREAGTVAGLVRYFAESAAKVLVRDEEIASDDQHIGSGDSAVTVTTYHKAKGLEWPVVVLSSLDRKQRRDAFEVCPETDRTSFDAMDPLGERWIRYWPWPFGAQKTTRLADAAEQSPEGLAVAAREERERVRLLYVGFTRARDHLIIAARIRKEAPAVAWLDELCDSKGQPLIHLPDVVAGVEGDGASIVISGLDGQTMSVPALRRVLDMGTEPPARIRGDESHRWLAPPDAQPLDRPSYWIAPSSAVRDWPDLAPLEVGNAERIGSRLPLGDSKGVSWDVVGNVVHAFLAADVPELAADQRVHRASRLLAAAGLLELLAPAALLQAGDSVRAWVDRKWPGATWHREVPVSAVIATPMGSRRVEGTIDLLIETPDGVVIIDYKSWPGAQTTWQEKARELLPQIAAYAAVLRAAGKNVLSGWLGFVVGGGVVEVKVG